MANLTVWKMKCVFTSRTCVRNFVYSDKSLGSISRDADTHARTVPPPPSGPRTAIKISVVCPVQSFTKIRSAFVTCHGRTVMATKSRHSLCCACSKIRAIFAFSVKQWATHSCCYWLRCCQPWATHAIFPTSRRLFTLQLLKRVSTNNIMTQSAL